MDQLSRLSTGPTAAYDTHQWLIKRVAVTHLPTEIVQLWPPSLHVIALSRTGEEVFQARSASRSITVSRC